MIINFSFPRKYLLTREMIVTAVALMVVLFGVFTDIFANLTAEYGIISRVAVFAVFVSISTYFLQNLSVNEQLNDKLGDLTEEMTELNKKLQEKVRARTNELQKAVIHTDALIENLTVGLLEYDDNFTLLRINGAAEMILGIKRTDVLGKIISTKDVSRSNLSSLVEITYPILSATTQKSPAEEINPSSVTTHEMSVQYPQERNLQIVTLPLMEKSGHTTGLIKIVRDITREKEIARSKNEFITIAAHQLRTPLSVMKWVLGLFLSGEMGTITDSQRDMLSRSHVANEKMINLVNSLLDVTRVESGKFGYVFSPNDIEKIVEEVVESYEEQAKTKGLGFTFSKPNDPLPASMLDAEKINLAISKLIDNAVKYTPSGGTVSVSLRTLGTNIIFQIIDSGIGIPEMYRERIFERFFRTDAAVRVYPEGAGLGLNIAQSIITSHGGTIELNSDEGKGTTVTVTLPTMRRDQTHP